jgi:pimeloyl-ACP methyl ester carboxylesterase
MTEAKQDVSRRAVVAGLTVAAAGAGAPAALAQSAPRTFVLVHGAWHGGWCWRRVSDLLERRGHKVFAPTLTGLGERSHLLSGSIDLDTHIADIVNLIKWEDLSDICLVAHSYGGWPGSAVPERIGEAIGSIVFLDAFMPEDGMKGLDLNSPQSKKDVLAAVEKGEVSRPPRGGEPSPTMTPEDRAWLASKATAQPIGVSLDPIKLTGARDRVPKRAFIRARGYPNPNFDDAYNACKAKGYSVFDVPCGHSVQVEMPDRLTEILLQVSA